MKRVLVLAAALTAAAGSGCANARYVQKATDEGVIAIPANTDHWPDYNRTKALELIQAHVGPSYDIVSEQEVVTGHTTINQQDTKREATFNGSIPFLPAEKQMTTTSTTQVPQKEWQIQYRKRVASATAAWPRAGVGQPPTQPASATQPTAPGAGVVPAGGLPMPDMGAMPR